MKERIKEFARGLGVDDVGVASVAAYDSPRSPAIEELFPGARSIIVMTLREMSHCESPSPQIAMAGRMDAMEFGRRACFELGGFIERHLGGRAMSIPLSYPQRFTREAPGTVGEVSLRHAAVAAGQGAWGRHNLVIHPRLGARVLFLGLLTDLVLTPDPVITESLCTDCNICVEECPAGALDVEGQTDVMKCLRISQPFGIGGSIGFWRKHAGSSPGEQQKMVSSLDFMRLYQAQIIGYQYFCFKCYAGCPVGCQVQAPDRDSAPEPV